MLDIASTAKSSGMTFYKNNFTWSKPAMYLYIPLIRGPLLYLLFETNMVKRNYVKKLKRTASKRRPLFTQARHLYMQADKSIV